MSRDRAHEWANFIVGLKVPRWWIRRLSKRRFEKTVKYIEYIWYTANDNRLRKVERPAWFPKKYVWGNS